MAQPVVGEMEMHSVANLATLQTPLATFFPSKKAPKPSFWESPVLPCECEVLLSQRVHTPLALCVCSVSLPAHAHTPLSLSLFSASAQFLSQRAHTPLSLSLCVCSVSLQRVHTPLSLCVCSVSLQRSAERSSALIQLNTDIMMLL